MQVVCIQQSQVFSHPVIYDNWDFSLSLTFCIRETPKWVFLQTVKIQMYNGLSKGYWIKAEGIIH